MIRDEVADLVSNPLPPESSSQEEIDEARLRLEAIGRPVTREEAIALVYAFPPEDETCYGLAWALVELVESAPEAGMVVFDSGSSEYWTHVLNLRAEAWREANDR